MRSELVTVDPLIFFFEEALPATALGFPFAHACTVRPRSPRAQVLRVMLFTRHQQPSQLSSAAQSFLAYNHCGVGSTSAAATSPRTSSATANRSHNSSVSKQKLSLPPPCRSALHSRHSTSIGFAPETHLMPGTPVPLSRVQPSRTSMSAIDDPRDFSVRSALS